MYTLKRVATLTVVLALGTLGLTACSSDEPVDDVSDTPTVDVASRLAGMNRKAEVDPETATVRLPADYVVQETEEEGEVISAAHDAAAAECAREELGIPWVATEPAELLPTDEMWSDYGPWTKSVAEKFAFVEPQSDRKLIFNGYVEKPEGYVGIEDAPGPNDHISASQLEEIREACVDKPELLRFDAFELWEYGPGQEALNDEVDTRQQDPKMQALLEELRVCYVENGIEFDENLAWVGFAADAAPASEKPNEEHITEEQIQLALKTVECKDQINFTQRVADIIAERQVPIIEEYADDLFTIRAKWDNAAAEAKEYIASHPELFEPVSSNKK
ncbi:hypothetical protein [Actinobaculum sp. 313]|uniref:hypothetical protein n=1 Tax=Actinobaculum sp. 313 TaxID=2495645 RepID=UPI000D52A2B3|nr:hypothetical protein [Actinobaculum sp. 313]AWE43214.1 hypothetical protein DDD63_11195 [Actinobaculum sp. 313]